MRVLGFSEKWPKLKQEEFTTFRFSRKDRDWAIGEQVQIVYHPRSKGRDVLGVAEIISKEARSFSYNDTFPVPLIEEVLEDGFDNFDDMWEWLCKTYGNRVYHEPMNKLTLKWFTAEADSQ